MGSIIILFIVLLGIAFRKLSPMRLPIWLIMLLGALAALLSQQISFVAAWQAINWNIIGYLTGVFIIGQALEESGYLQRLGQVFFAYAHNCYLLILLIFILAGIASAILMNDTIAIILTPLLLILAQQQQLPAKILLLSLAFAVTIGSVMSPIGNPQNLLIALEGNLTQPFAVFFGKLMLPTCINLVIGVLVIFAWYHKPLQRYHLQNNNVVHVTTHTQPQLTRLSKIAMLLFIGLMVFHQYVPFAAIALISAAPIIIFSQQRFTIIKKMDWHTLVFFIAMFILMQSVWDSGILQTYLHQRQLHITSTPSIILISVILSQFISNVPLVALYLPVLMHHAVSTDALMALAAGSTIAGNFLIMGAASNVIIIQNAEKRDYHDIGFAEFAKVGGVIGILNMVVYTLWLIFI